LAIRGVRKFRGSSPFVGRLTGGQDEHDDDGHAFADRKLPNNFSDEARYLSALKRAGFFLFDAVIDGRLASRPPL
jgi:hypothetical protein